jgi:hypothetical protein
MRTTRLDKKYPGSARRRELQLRGKKNTSPSEGGPFYNPPPSDNYAAEPVKFDFWLWGIMIGSGLIGFILAASGNKEGANGMDSGNCLCCILAAYEV